MSSRATLAALLATALLLVFAASALADSTVSVNTTSDSPTAGQCSLREAVAYADGTAEPACAAGLATGTTTINLPSGTYTLTGGGLSVTANTVIDGQGASSTTISGANSFQVFNIAASIQVLVNDVTITGGLSGVATTGCSGPPFFSCPMENGDNGGGIVNAGTLTLNRAILTGNNASAGTRPTGLFFIFCAPNCAAQAGASAGNGGWGGGIDNTGTLTITNSTISNNNAGQGGDGTNATAGEGTGAGAGANGGSGGAGGNGGAICNETGAHLAISGSTISGNSAGRGGNAGAGSNSTAGTNTGGSAGGANAGGVGGAILNFGTVTITNSTVTGNQSGRGGNGATGGAGTGGGSNGTSSFSSVGGVGGGIYTASSQTTTLTNDTFAVNAASPGGTGGAGAGSGGSGGAIYHVGVGLVQLSFATITSNTAAATVGGIDNAGAGTMTESASILASNTGSPAENCSTAKVTDLGSNLVFGDNSCPGQNADPRLGTLASNGGPTQTMALLPGSAAINEVPSNACPVATDQRGVARPEGTACDAGAYEFAPPTIGSPSATGTSPTTGTVTAAINPNLTSRDTIVTVRYGTTAAYGSTATTQTIGAGATAVSFSASIGGLSPGSTYHYDIVAANGDGTTSSADGTFTTLHAVATSINRASSVGPALTLDIACNGGAATSVCAGPITLTTRVTSIGRSAVAVSAATTQKKKPKPPKSRPKRVTRTVRVGTGTFSVTSGHTKTLHLKLNATGVKLLAQFYKLPVKVALGGDTPTSRSLSFGYGRLHVSPAFEWAFSKTFAFATQLTIASVPKGSHVALVCKGHGCPFSARTFARPKRGKLQLAPALKQRHLSVGSTVDVQITAPNDIGEVVRFTVISGKLPKESFLCLPPRARTPSACVS